MFDFPNEMGQPVSDLTGDSIAQEYGWFIFELANNLTACIGVSELAQKELDPSHSALKHVTTTLESARRALAAVKTFDDEFRVRTETQESILKRRLLTYAHKLHSYKQGQRHVIQLFGIFFPVELKGLVLSTGVDDPGVSQDDTFFDTITFEKGTEVFELTPTGEEKVLYTFGSQTGDGNTPLGDLVFDTAGNLYGVTENGGAYGYGTVFEIIP